MRGLLVVSMFAVPLLAGCLSGSDSSDDADKPSAGAQRVPPKQWIAELSKPRFDDWTASLEFITAADGAQLSLTAYLPAGLPNGEKIPTLLEITPYDAGATYEAPVLGTTGPGSFNEPYVLAGAAYVAADARGTNGSAGCLDFGGSADRADAVAFVAWVRAQPWSNGVVVTDGVSHPGMGSVVAHAAVGDLNGALAHAPVVSYYQDEWYYGAKFEDQINGEGYQEVELFPAAYLDPASLAAQPATCTGETLLDFNTPEGTFTPMWDDRDLSRHNEAAAAPILLTQGFIDQNVHPDHVQLYWDSLPDEFPKSVIWGWWYHGYPDMEGHAAKEFENIRHRWLDERLFGRDTGLAAEPRVLVEDSKGIWHEGNDWPLEPSDVVTLWPDASGALLPTAPGEGAATYTDTIGARRGTWTDASVAFRTAPFTQATLINGAPTVELVASSSVDQTKWVVYLLDEAPDGSWQRVTHGYTDSHTWDGETDWKAMQPGTTYNWTVRLMPTAVVVEAGHRLTLLVASQDSRLPFPLLRTTGLPTFCFDDYLDGCYNPSGILPSATVGRAENTILTGPQGTRVTLAWVDPDATAKPPWS